MYICQKKDKQLSLMAVYFASVQHLLPIDLYLLLTHSLPSVSLSHLTSSANPQHCWVCGLQPIQPPGLQQLQARREPRHQRSGNGMNINLEENKVTQNQRQGQSWLCFSSFQSSVSQRDTIRPPKNKVSLYFPSKLIAAQLLKIQVFVTME